MFAYKSLHGQEERIAEAQRLRSKHPELIPIIVERHTQSSLPQPDKSKFLSPFKLKSSDLIGKIRSKLELTQQQSLMAFIDGVHLMPVDKRMCEIYDQYKSPDGFLYILYSEQESFGSTSN
jgi:GABA(A) receptor-associated protein